MRRVAILPPTLVALAAFLAPGQAAAVDYVVDPLTDAAFAGRGSEGGVFSAAGFTTVGEADAFWYEIPDALPSGRIEYTVAGLSVGGTLSGTDHDILTMYQAPSGVAEPVAYSPYFRNNDFKAFTRIFGSLEPDRGGAMKLELAFCPRGDPWYHDTPCDPSCDRSGLAYANGAPTDVGWDPAVAYRMALEWGGGSIRFARDGVTLGTVGYPGEYAPQPLRVRFGSPRHDGVYPGLAFMPHGITFRDVLVTGAPGTMTPVCAAEVPDGGVPDAGSGGSAPVDSGISTGSYDVLADVTAASWEPGVFPDVGDLNVEGDGASPQAVVYLRFPALAGTVTHAVLRVHAQAIPSAAGGSGEVCAVADDGWDENTLTWATRPAVGACTGAVTAVDPDTDIVWDVTSLVTSGAHVNLAILSHDPDGAHFLSKESGGAGQGPKLVVELGPAGTGGSGGAGTGGSGTGAGSGTGGSGSGAGPAGGAPAEDTKGGCGCRTTGDENTALGAAALAAALGLGARLRRRRRRASVEGGSRS